MLSFAVSSRQGDRRQQGARRAGQRLFSRMVIRSTMLWLGPAGIRPRVALAYVGGGAGGANRGREA